MLKIISLLLLLPFCVQAQDIYARHLSLGIRESLEARIDKTREVIQIGNEQGFVEYTLEGKTVADNYLSNEPFFGTPLPKVVSTTLRKKELAKEYEEIIEKVDTFLDAKISYITPLEDSVFMVAYKIKLEIPSLSERKKTPHRTYYRVGLRIYFIKVEDNKLEVLFRQGLSRKRIKQIEVFHNNIHNQYFYVDRTEKTATSYNAFP
ncbi:MAG: hypothetical protein MK212_02030 [Saprospiraceae bacterium]|nr:hypothetical protein [Saprospiraceae bacterium]